MNPIIEIKFLSDGLDIKQISEKMENISKIKINYRGKTDNSKIEEARKLYNVDARDIDPNKDFLLSFDCISSDLDFSYVDKTFRFITKYDTKLTYFEALILLLLKEKGGVISREITIPLWASLPFKVAQSKDGFIP